MKTFLYRLLQFTIGSICILYALEAFIYFKREDLFSEKYLAHFYENKIRAHAWVNTVEPKQKIIILGSSGAKMGIGCGQLKKLSGNSSSVVSISDAAQDPVEYYFLIKSAFEKDSCIQKIYLEINPLVFTKKYYINRPSHFKLDYSLIQSIRYAVEYDIPVMNPRFQALWDYFFVSKYRFRTENLVIPPDFGARVFGIDPYEAVELNNITDPADFFELDKYGWSEHQFIYLKKIIDLCEDKEIPLQFFVTPFRPDFSATYRAKYKDVQREFAQRLVADSITPTIFGRFDLLDSLTDKDIFADKYHLNENGQVIFTEMFYNMMNANNPALNENYIWIK